MKTTGKEVTFTKGKHFSRAGLVEHLNKKFGGKYGGSDFTTRDIGAYERRGVLPTLYGAHPIKKISIPHLGVFVEVDFDKTITAD